MNLEDYKLLIQETDFKEYPKAFIPDKDYLCEIIDYDETDISLKIYIAKLILCRSFYGTYTAWYKDVKWFIDSFYKEFQNDLIKPELSGAIREAAEMIMNEDVFAKGIIGTTFMFGVLEFYAKYKLGFRPSNYNFFDSKKKEYIKQLNPNVKQKDLSIKSAFEYLQKQSLPVSKSLNDIDNFTTKHLSDKGINSRDWIQYKIADRLALARNPMLHGEIHSFYDKGSYLLMLYILFHLYELEETYITSGSCNLQP